jgi:hypothetical protein
MPRRKEPPQPPQPPRRGPSSRRPVTDVDRRLTVEILRLRARIDPQPSGVEIAERAGRSIELVRRLLPGLRDGEPSPHQAWMVADLVDIARALDARPTDVLIAAGIDTIERSLAEAIIADPDLTPADKATLVRMADMMRSATRQG